jgi:polar amino acid transport system substrate-binding protein
MRLYLYFSCTWQIKGLFRTSLLLLCLYPLQAFASETMEPLKISCHPAYPPVMFIKNQKPMGIAIDIATDILNDLRVPYELVFAGPWNRVQQSARLGKIDMIASIYYNKERALYLDYALPVIEDPVVIFVWQGKEFEFNNLEDLVPKTGTSNLGESYGVEVDAFLEKNVSMQRVVKSEMNFKFLELGRADFFMFGLYAGRAQALLHGYGAKIVALPKPVTTENFYIAFSKKSPYKYLIPKINALIESSITPEKIRSLNEKNLKLYINQ